MTASRFPLSNTTDKYLGRLQHMSEVLDQNPAEVKVADIIRVSQSTLIAYKELEISKLEKNHPEETISKLRAEVSYLNGELTHIKVMGETDPVKVKAFIDKMIKFEDYLDDPQLLINEYNKSFASIWCSNHCCNCTIL